MIDPLITPAAIATGLGTVATAAKSGQEILSLANELSETMKKNAELKPDVRGLRIDYQNKTSTLSFLASPPKSMLGAKRLDVVIPTGYKIHEVYADGWQPVHSTWQQKGEKWTAKHDSFTPKSQFMVILTGRVTKQALNDMVTLRSPSNPDRSEEQDVYWLQSAIRNPTALEKLYTQLHIDRVDLKVGVGVEKQFTGAIKPEVKALLEERAKLSATLNSKKRDLNLARARVQSARRKAGNMDINKFHELVKRLASGDEFGEHIKAQKPFEVSHVAPLQKLAIIPDVIDVGVIADLSLQQPAIEGSLVYKKRDFQSKLQKQFDALEK